MPRPPEGLLPVNKPAGWSSHDAVAKTRAALARELGVKPLKIKAGHGGTLDPAASGLLVIGIGKYTKKLGALSKLKKTYQAKVTLGARSDTDDSEGRIEPVKNARPPSSGQVRRALKAFEGEHYQTPPSYSAVKVGGRRAYKLARQGRPAKLKPRKVTVYAIKNITYRWPEVDFEAEVSAGTYIRSIARDLGEKLGCGAYLGGLVRTAIGEYRLADALDARELTAERIKSRLIK